MVEFDLSLKGVNDVFKRNDDYGLVWCFVYGSEPDLQHPMLASLRGHDFQSIASCLLTLQKGRNAWIEEEMPTLQPLPVLEAICGGFRITVIDSVEALQEKMPLIVDFATQVQTSVEARQKKT